MSGGKGMRAKTTQGWSAPRDGGVPTLYTPHRKKKKLVAIRPLDCGCKEGRHSPSMSPEWGEGEGKTGVYSECMLPVDGG